MLHRAVAAAPADDDRSSRRAELRLVPLGINRRRHDGDAIRVASRVLCEIRVADHDVRGKATDRCGLPGTLQHAQVAVRWAYIRLEHRVVEIENYRHTRSREEPLDDRWPENRRLAKQIHEINPPSLANHGGAPRKRGGDRCDLFSAVTLSIQHGVELRRFEWGERDLYAVRRKPRCPLFEAKSLTGGGVVLAGNDRENPHR